MQMKLAKYDLETKEFSRFLNVGRDFLFGGKQIVLIDNTIIKKTTMREINTSGWAEGKYQKDLKDPLNRFDGLFNGRTYGNGQFVLITQCNFDAELFEDDFWMTSTGRILWKHVFALSPLIYDNLKKKVGNIHQNPDLYQPNNAL